MSALIAWTMTPVSEVGGWPVMLTRPSQTLQVGSPPVPGGVGPMTIAMLMENTVRAAEAVHHR